jgi:ATP-dependent RNA helicase DeaD
MEMITMPNEADTRPKNKTAKTKTAAAKSETKKPKRKDKRAAESAAPTPAAARKKAETKTATKAVPASREEITTVTSDAAASVNETSAEPTTEVAAEPGFDQLGLAEPIARAIAALGFEAPTPIQARAIPLLLAGRDLIGQAQTGTGKTAAFALPMIEKIDASRRETQALVLAPTRELAVQVAGGIHDLAKNSGLQVVPVYGGQPIDRQFRALRQGAHIVVGTPGRVLDHLRRGSLSLETVTFCVLDEADEMLALGFLEDMEAILALLPEQRQLAFFSATMPPRIAALTKRFLRDAEHVSIDAKRRTVESVEQTYYEVPRGKKMEALARVLDMETPGPTIVFCHTRQATNELAEALRLRGYGAEALNGEMSQADRERVLRRFRDGQADLLVATDVAARGLDIDTVTHVINYDIPWDVEQYIHRIGRTGRAGRTGDAITLLEARERRQLKFIERMIGVTLKPARIPTAADIAARRRDVFKGSLRDMLEGGEFDGHMATVEELSESYDAAEIAAAALQMLWQSQHNAPTELAEELAADGEQPESGMTRIFVGLGRQDGLRPGELVAAIASKSGLSGRSIGTIDILDRSTFVEVPTAESDNVISALRRIKIRGRKAKVDVATPRR